MKLEQLELLPTCILLLSLLSPRVQAQAWHADLAPHEKYFPEHEEHLRKEWQIRQRMQSEQPVGMRKLSGDAGEKFFLDYWRFEDALSDSESQGLFGDAGGSILNYDLELPPTVNESSAKLLAPVLLHSDSKDSILSRYLRRNIFERSFQCPAGTSNCASIGQPNSCCQIGEVCVSVANSPVGPVGCCPSGETCNGAVATCNTAQGYTSCPNSPNGGCCIPGYACKDVGCILTGTTTIVTSLPISTVTSGMTPITNIAPSSATTTTTAVTIVVPAATSSVQTVTTTIVLRPSTSAIPTTVVQTITITQTASTSPPPIVQGPLTCTMGYQSCPASLGGGCCPTDRACGSPTCPPLSTVASTAPAGAPIRPTSISSFKSVSGPPSSSTSTVSAAGCPTGFYMCSAYYMGGCCQVDRNCDTTSCPPQGSTIVVTSTSVTIVAASPTSSAAGPQGTCNNGWFACGSNDGGGCCPSGFICGASCTATISGQSNIGKQAPSMGTRGHITGWGFLSLGLAAGLAMVIL